MKMFRICIVPTCPQPVFGCTQDGKQKYCADCWTYGNGDDCPITTEATHGICNACQRELALKRKKPPKGV